MQSKAEAASTLKKRTAAKRTTHRYSLRRRREPCAHRGGFPRPHARAAAQHEAAPGRAKPFSPLPPPLSPAALRLCRFWPLSSLALPMYEREDTRRSAAAAACCTVRCIRGAFDDIRVRLLSAGYALMRALSAALRRAAQELNAAVLARTRSPAPRVHHFLQRSGGAAPRRTPHSALLR